MNICSTRDTEVMTIESEESEDTEAAAEPRHHDEEDHDHDVFNPREDAEWDFKAGTCVFRLQWVKHNIKVKEGGALQQDVGSGGIFTIIIKVISF